MSTLDRAAPIGSVVTGGRAARLWRAIRDKGISLALTALAVFCCAAIPLHTTMKRTQAEFQISTLQQDILTKQVQRARLERQVADRLSIASLERAGKEIGLGPPVLFDYLTIP